MKKEFPDYQLLAVRDQLRAMGCERYDVGAMREGRGMISWPDQTPDQVESLLSTLAGMNAKGDNIYIRPAETENRALILVDDVKANQLYAMEDAGLFPACVVKTSEIELNDKQKKIIKNYQAWVSFGPEPMMPEYRKVIARILAHDFNGDEGSTDASHYGRLAGFTNQKTSHTRANGTQPFCSIANAAGKQASDIAVQKMLSRARKILAEQQATLEHRQSSWQQNAPATQEKTPEEAQKIFKQYFNQWLIRQQRPGINEEPDYSQGDWKSVCMMLEAGIPIPTVEAALLAGSPNLANRKKGHEQDYAHRTVINAAKNCGIR